MVVEHVLSVSVFSWVLFADSGRKAVCVAAGLQCDRLIFCGRSEVVWAHNRETSQKEVFGSKRAAASVIRSCQIACYCG